MQVLMIQTLFGAWLIDSVWLQIQDLYKEAGFLGFWKGVVPALIMVSLMSHFLLLSYFFFTSYCFHVSSVIRLATLQSNSCCTRLF
jgi:hypothetical protein